jgi:cytosine/adenosine deaminase-related metal-dependent hydrolase
MVRNGRFLTLESGFEPFTGWMAVGDDGRVAALGAGEPRPVPDGVDVLDAKGAFVAPGFVSAHSHLHTSGSRGLGMDQSLYGWCVAITDGLQYATPEDMYWFVLHGSLDFLNNGTTTAFDFTSGRLDFVSDSPGRAEFVADRLRPPEHEEEQFRAKVDAGIRFVNAVMLDDAFGSHDETIDRLDDLVDYSRKYADHPGFLKMALSGAVQWSPQRSTAEIEAEAMDRHGLVNQPHFLETPYEVEFQRSKFAWYRDAGAFGPDLVFGHFVQASDDQMAEAAETGCGMVWQPASNGRLASGVANVPHARRLGMRVGVGLDDQACTDISDPFQNMRIGICLQRAANKDPLAMGVQEMLELHTIESARVLGIEGDVGSLEVGKFADFLVVDPRSPDTGPVWDDIGTYVLACGLRNLKQVWVGGELVSQDGEIVSVDADEASGELHDRFARIRHDHLV